ncbi:serine-rich adhesin for platelets-like [Ylistrum balloti]|uniref:serine-rich adhesin for platelets-like n=1 Tax=Ylistrum balloti TaxID=509963 RepID=UPI002905ABAD|nr:serine-rich adhesin for platelets-like [Ylistrum balloti]
MSGEGRYNKSGLPMFHLRRIGPPATKPGVADIMDFFEVTTMIGKSAQSMYQIDSASEMRRSYISRNHARVVIRSPNNDHMMFDDNNVLLCEGDKVTFGHPQGAKIPCGMRKLQPDSEYQFLFEKCNCPGQMIVCRRSSVSGTFVVPESPVHAGKSSSKKRDRNTTQILTAEDILKLVSMKEELEKKSLSQSSATPSQPSTANSHKINQSEPDPPALQTDDNITTSVVSYKDEKNCDQMISAPSVSNREGSQSCRDGTTAIHSGSDSRGSQNHEDMTTIHSGSESSGSQNHEDMTTIHSGSDSSGSQNHEDMTTIHSGSNSRGSQNHEDMATIHSVSDSSGSRNHEDMATIHSVSDSSGSQNHEDMTTIHSVSDSGGSQNLEDMTAIHSGSESSGSQNHEDMTTIHSVSNSRGSQNHEDMTTIHSVSDSRGSQNHEDMTTIHSGSDSSGSQNHEDMTTIHSGSNSRGSQNHEDMAAIHSGSDSSSSQNHEDMTTIHSVSNSRGSQNHEDMTTIHSVSNSRGSQNHEDMAAIHSVSDSSSSQNHEDMAAIHSGSDSRGSQNHEGMTTIHSGSDSSGSQNHEGMTTIHSGSDSSSSQNHEDMTTIHSGSDSSGSQNHEGMTAILSGGDNSSSQKGQESMTAIGGDNRGSPINDVDTTAIPSNSKTAKEINRDTPDLHIPEDSSRVLSEDNGTKVSAIGEQTIVNKLEVEKDVRETSSPREREVFFGYKEEKGTANHSGPAEEFSINSTNPKREDSFEIFENVPDKLSSSDEENSVERFSLSEDDSFEDANMPTNTGSQLCKVIHSHMHPCLAKTSTPKPKQTGLKGPGPVEVCQSRGNCSQKSTILKNVSQAGQADKVSQQDAAIQTSPLVPLVEEISSTDAQQEGQCSADTEHYKEEDPIVQPIQADTTRQAGHSQTTKNDADHTSTCNQDSEPGLKIDPEVKSCESRSTDSAECPTEVMMSDTNDLVGVFDDLDMEDVEFSSDNIHLLGCDNFNETVQYQEGGVNDKTETRHNTKEGSMNMSDNMGKTELVSDDLDEIEPLPDNVDKTELVSDDLDEIEPLPDNVDKTELVSDDSDEIEPLPDNVDKTELVSDDLDEIEPLPDNVDKTELVSDDSDEIEPLPDFGNKTELVSGDLDEIEPLPVNINKTETVLVRDLNTTDDHDEDLNKTKDISYRDVEGEVDGQLDNTKTENIPENYACSTEPGKTEDMDESNNVETELDKTDSDDRTVVEPHGVITPDKCISEDNEKNIPESTLSHIMEMTSIDSLETVPNRSAKTSVVNQDLEFCEKNFQNSSENLPRKKAGPVSLVSESACNSAEVFFFVEDGEAETDNPEQKSAERAFSNEVKQQKVDELPEENSSSSGISMMEQNLDEDEETKNSDDLVEEVIVPIQIAKQVKTEAIQLSNVDINSSFADTEQNLNSHANKSYIVFHNLSTNICDVENTSFRNEDNENNDNDKDGIDGFRNANKRRLVMDSDNLNADFSCCPDPEKRKHSTVDMIKNEENFGLTCKNIKQQEENGGVTFIPSCPDVEMVNTSHTSDGLSQTDEVDGSELGISKDSVFVTAKDGTVKPVTNQNPSLTDSASVTFDKQEGDESSLWLGEELATNVKQVEETTNTKTVNTEQILKNCQGSQQTDFGAETNSVIITEQIPEVSSITGKEKAVMDGLTQVEQTLNRPITGVNTNTVTDNLSPMVQIPKFSTLERKKDSATASLSPTEQLTTGVNKDAVTDGLSPSQQLAEHLTTGLNKDAVTDGLSPSQQIAEHLTTGVNKDAVTDGLSPSQQIAEHLTTGVNKDAVTDSMSLTVQKPKDLTTGSNINSVTYKLSPFEQITRDSTTGSNINSVTYKLSPSEQIITDSTRDGNMELPTDGLTLTGQTPKNSTTGANVGAETDGLTLTGQIPKNSTTGGNVDAETDGVTPVVQRLECSATNGCREAGTNSLLPMEQILQGFQSVDGNMEILEDDKSPVEQIQTGCQADGNVAAEAVGLTGYAERMPAYSPTDGNMEPVKDGMNSEAQIIKGVPADSNTENADSLINTDQTPEASWPKDRSREVVTNDMVSGERILESPVGIVNEESVTDVTTTVGQLLDSSQPEDTNMEALTKYMPTLEQKPETSWAENGNMEADDNIMLSKEEILERTPADGNIKSMADSLETTEAIPGDFLIEKKVGSIINRFIPVKQIQCDSPTGENMEALTPTKLIPEDCHTSRNKDAVTDSITPAFKSLEGSQATDENININDESVTQIESSFTEARMKFVTADMTPKERVLESSPTGQMSNTDEGFDNCVFTETCSVGSTSPISKNIQAIQDFCQSVSPLVKTTENNRIEDVYTSPVSKRQQDKLDASDMITCLEDSITSVDISDQEDVSVSFLEIKDIPPVYILDKEALEEEKDHDDSCTDQVKEKKNSTKTPISQHLTEGHRSDITQTETQVGVQESVSGNFPSKEGKISSRECTLESSVTDCDGSIQNKISDAISAKKDSLHQENDLKADVNKENVVESNGNMERSEMTERNSMDSHQESSLGISSLPLTDSCTSQFSESDLVRFWEVDNRKLDSAKSVEAIDVGSPTNEPCTAVVSTADYLSAVVSTVASTEMLVASLDVPSAISTNVSADISSDFSKGLPTQMSSEILEDVSNDLNIDVSSGMKASDEDMKEPMQDVESRLPIEREAEDRLDESEEISSSDQRGLCLKDTKEQPACSLIEKLSNVVTTPYTNIEALYQCSPETDDEPDQQLDKNFDDTVSGRHASGKRKRKLSDRTSEEDEIHSAKKKRTAWYQSVKTTLSNFFNIRHKVVFSKKSLSSKKSLKKENIAKIVKRFFVLNDKRAESDMIPKYGFDDNQDCDSVSDDNNDRGDMESSNMREDVTKYSVQKTPEYNSYSSGTDSVLTKPSEQISTCSTGQEPKIENEGLFSAFPTDLTDEAGSDEFGGFTSFSSKQCEGSKVPEETIVQLSSLVKEDVSVNDSNDGNTFMSTKVYGAAESPQGTNEATEIQTEREIYNEASIDEIRCKDSSHGDVDEDDRDVSGESKGFHPCLDTQHEDRSVSETRYVAEEIATQKSVNEFEKMETVLQKTTDSMACSAVSTENDLERNQQSPDSVNRNQDFTQDRACANSESSELPCIDTKENLESLLGPVEDWLSSANEEETPKSSDEEEQDFDSDSESILAPKCTVEIKSSGDYEKHTTSDSNQESLSELSSKSQDTENTEDDQVQSTSDKSVANIKKKSTKKTENLKKDSQNVPEKSLLSNIPMLDPMAKTYSLSEMDSSDISIITLRSSDELEYWEGNDLNEDDMKGISTNDTDIVLKNKINLKQEMEEPPIQVLASRDRHVSVSSTDKVSSQEKKLHDSEDYTRDSENFSDHCDPMNSMVTVSNSEMTEQNTDLSSINYCPLPDFETDSSVDDTKPAVDFINQKISPRQNEIMISDSSDELPEVVFLKEERRNPNIQIKSEFTDVFVKQERVTQECGSSVSSTQEKDTDYRPVVQKGLNLPSTTRSTRSYVPERGLNLPASEISSSTSKSSFEDQGEEKKGLSRKRRKKKSPVKNKNKIPEKKQTTPSKYNRRPRRKKKSGKCCDKELIELITDSDSDSDGPSKSKSPAKSVEKEKDKVKKCETSLLARHPAKKSDDLQDDIQVDLGDNFVVDSRGEHEDDPGMAEEDHNTEPGQESSVQDIFNSDEESSLLALYDEEDMFTSSIGLETAFEETSSTIERHDIQTNAERQTVLELVDTFISEDTFDFSDEFSCQGDQSMDDFENSSVGDEDDADDNLPLSPPRQSSFDDEDDANDIIPNTCDEDDDNDMSVPVLHPLSSLEPQEESTPSLCMSPVFPDITMPFDMQAQAGGKPAEKFTVSASEMFDSEDEFSVPDLDLKAFEDSNDKVDEESSENAKDVEEIECDDTSPLQHMEGIDSDCNEDCGMSISVTPQPDDVSLQSTTGIKKRKLFNIGDLEMDEIPLPKRSRTKHPSRPDFPKISPASKLKKAFDDDLSISTQCPLLANVNESQFNNASKQFLSTEKNSESSAKKRKAKEFLVNVKAKLMKYKTKKQTTLSQSESVQSSQETPGEIPSAGSVQRRSLTEAEISSNRIADYLTRCKSVVSRLREALDGHKLGTFPRVSQWRNDLLGIEEKMVLPNTTIAVVGDTGSGKSSLMNAVIDQHNTLPTSGMRACTAVVVEVLANTTSDNYEADIKFLSRKEWFDELKLLISDLTTADGKLKKSVPDLESEAGVALLKVKAVYGKVDTVAVLSHLTAVTRMLDKVKTIRATNPKDFRRLIDRYIETADPGAGGQFWPIVKQVTIRMPDCDACSSGAVLVDLPGVCDSNAARDRIAREYLKNCTVVWVVAAIHRAINNKTAKDMLGENFRRQLLMDGQYGSVAFICTKSDDLMPSELIRNLHLEDVCEPLENEIQSLLMEKKDANKTVNRLKKEIRTVKKEIKELTTGIADLKETMEMTYVLDGDVIDLDSEGADGLESLEELRQVVQDKEESLKVIQREKTDKERGMDQATRESLEIDKKIDIKRKEIAVICANARNEYSKSTIKRDFKAGLREMKRKAGLTNADEDDEMEDEDQDYNSDYDDDEMSQTAENLRVFCVSSMEYQKMKNLLPNDGPANIFSTTEDTQIPKLRRYIHEVTASRRQQYVDRLIRTLGQFVFDVQNYIMADGTTCKGTRRDAKSTVEENCKDLEGKFEPVLSHLSQDIEEIFCNSIETKMTDGVNSAISSANETVSKWGAKQNKERKSDGGLHWKTYQCVVNRHGVFNSKTYGPINFNEQLSEPMYRCISVCWDKVFSGLLWRTLEDCESLLLITLTVFVRELCEKLQTLEVQRNQTDRVSTQLCHSTKDKLAEMLANLKELVLSRQRDINRIITPAVQENLDQTYNLCESEAGNGMFTRIKEAMAGGVDFKRHNMFSEASLSLLQNLVQLKDDIVSHVRSVCASLCLMLQAAFEPLWEAPSQTKLLKDHLFDSVTEAVLAMTSLHTDANLTLPVVPSQDLEPDQDIPTASDQVSTEQGPYADRSLPGPPGLQVATTTCVGPQMYTSTYRTTQKMATGAHSKTCHVSIEKSKSTQVTDVLKHLKQEPRSPKLMSPSSIKKEWDPSSELTEVSGPELSWFHNALPDLDSYTGQASPMGMLTRSSTITQTVELPNSGLSPGESSSIHQTQARGSPQISSTMPQASSWSTGHNRSGLSPRITSTTTRPQASSWSTGPIQFGQSPQVTSTTTRPQASSCSWSTGSVQFGQSPQVTSTTTRPQASSWSTGSVQFGQSPQVSTTTTRPQAHSPFVGQSRSERSSQISSSVTPHKGKMSSGSADRFKSTIVKPQTTGTIRSNVPQSVPIHSHRIVMTNSTATIPVCQSPDSIIRVQGNMDLGNKLCFSETSDVTQKSKHSRMCSDVLRDLLNSPLETSSACVVGSHATQGIYKPMQKTGSVCLPPKIYKISKTQPETFQPPRNSQSLGVTNGPGAKQVSIDVVSALSSQPVKGLVSIVNRDLIKPQRQLSSPSVANSQAAPSQTSGGPIVSSSQSVPRTSPSNSGRLKLSLRKRSESPTQSRITVKQEPTEGDTSHQRRVRRFNNHEIIDLCDSSDNEN